jgi:hypothetical protein
MKAKLTRELVSISSSSSIQLDPIRLKSQKDLLPFGLTEGGSCCRKVTLWGVLQNISIESFKHRSMSISGMSEKRRIHSLNPDSNKDSRSCCNTARPMQRGNEEFPSNNLSHKWKILWSGNTSEVGGIKRRINILDRRFNCWWYSRANIVKNQGIAYRSGTNPMQSKWLRKTGSWKAIRCENLARYSWITDELSFQKKLFKYFGMNAARQAYANAEMRQGLKKKGLKWIDCNLIETRKN